MSSLTEIAEEILAHAKRLDEYTSAKNLPSASFEHNSLGDLPIELEATRKALVDSTQTLKSLALGPVGTNIDIAYSAADVLALRIIYEYNIAQIVPLEGSISYAEISKACGLSETLVFRFMRHAMANHIFAEPSPGHVRHTAFSRQCVVEPAFSDMMGMLLCEVDPAYSRVTEAFAKFPNSGEPAETAYNLANDTTLPMYAFISQHPERARRFGSAMRWATKSVVWDLKHLVSSYDWAAFDSPGALLVDVGGGEGGVAQVLAKSTKNMKIVIQDLPGTVKLGGELLPPELKGRIEFAVHDFYTEQPIKGADAYFMRYILHNYSDRYCMKILRSLVPAMKDGAKVLVYEVVLSDKAATNYTEKVQANLDLIMLAMFNAAERTKDDWRKLFAQADTRFVFGDVYTTQGSELSLIEFIWKP
ncbi:hypothetical protein MMC13_002037 [Lambiella insularis]|nr:hypothetical protein [Lambiella insularis]